MGIALLALWSLVVGVAVLALTLYAIYGIERIPVALAVFQYFPQGLVTIAVGVLAVEVVTAYGLWTLSEWGRLLGIVFALISFGTGMLTLPIGFVGVLFSLATVWYLTEKKTRSLFRSAPRVAL
ncbi:MAG: hypothetical protein AABY30_05075 [Candidatus Thermoplasmatota archaeon]